MGPKAMRKTTYCEFVSDRQDSLETVYCNVMQSSSVVAERCI